MKILKRIFVFVVLMILLASTKVNASYLERIADYQSEVFLNEDSSMIVEETIKVYANGDEIKRGIYRDFPTKYKDKNKNTYKVKFEVLEVLRDGKQEPYKLEKQINGVRIRIGDENKILSSGYYTYTIKYKTARQIGYFSNYDELYWNVTGNGWGFEIDRATAIIHLPEKVNMKNVNYDAFTGKKGSTDKNYTAYKNEYDNTVTFVTTSKLEPEEGLTIVVNFDKGLVHEPTFKEKVRYFFYDNRGAFIGLCGAIVLIIYCYLTWSKIGRDPKKDIIIPRYNPPEGLSPAEVKYINSTGSYTKVFEASILNLAVHGYIKIETEEKSTFGIKSNTMTLKKQNKVISNDISEDEKEIYKSLPETAKLEYNSSLQKTLMLMQTGQKKVLKEKIEGKMYSKNVKYIVWSIIISIVTLIIAFIFSDNDMMGIVVAPFMSIWLAGWTSGIVAIFRTLKGVKKGLFMVFIIPFIIAEIVGVGVLISTIGIAMALILMIFVAINIAYAILIKAYTEEGRRIKDEIEGFILFIKTASEDEIMNQTPETFDKYFPYAYVLGLENEWAKKFENILKEFDYEPTWCTGMYVGNTFNVSSFTSSFSSSFSSSISSASTAPGSSSGSGGGGFSGGGGRRPEVAVAGKSNI